MTRLGRARSRGQTLPLFALMFVFLFGIVSLAIDGGHLYLVSRSVQNAVDAATLAAGRTLAAAAQWSPPSNSSNAAVTAAHDLAAVNGFQTTLNSSCDSYTSSQFKTSWFDVPSSFGCGAGAGSMTRIDVYVPPRVLTPNCAARPFNCIEVALSQKVQNYLFGALGIPSTTVSSKATVYAQPPGTFTGYPEPISVYLRQPQAGCTVGNQCFNESLAPARSNMSCAALNNCPTLWVRNGSNPSIKGFDGITNSAGDTVALESRGDIVVQDSNGLTICDPYNGASCPGGTTVGPRGFALDTGTKVICATGGTVQGAGLPACGAPGWVPAGTTGKLWGNGWTPWSISNWQPTVTFSGSDCGFLVLNGEPVHSHAGLSGQCDPGTNDLYTIKPGRYQYIVINHGQYEFASGLFDITSTAPLGQIDHSNESGDFDLCSGVCATTAGIWITHGGGSYGAYNSGGAGSCPSPGLTQAGGGDQTKILGVGVSFRFTSGSGGFVSSHEVTSMVLIAPGFGALPAVNDIPLLFDLENSSFIHLDATPPLLGFNPNRFQGIIYQTGTATGGGVELNPGLAGGAGNAALNGQIIAYSLTTFGSPGIANDFSKGLSGASAPIISSAGQYEPSILAGVQLVPDSNPLNQALVVNYYDEFDLDAFDSYVKVNNGSAVYFSKGLWPGQPAPPANNNPGDLYPSYPVSSGPPANYTIVSSSPKPDWIYTYPVGDAAYGSKFEVSGDWSWGHQLNIISNGGGTGTGIFNQKDTLTYTFPIPPANQPTVSITIYMTDGDFCGDYVTATYTFYNVGHANPGQQVSGNVHLEQ